LAGRAGDGTVQADAKNDTRSYAFIEDAAVHVPKAVAHLEE
jgi:hypothetical protein